ncbi:MAG: hypothetical protein EOM64_03145, partial [Erysipelotrichia bacterium]|nr:hypothetical protein [Erysipelotrichia bacterium]
YCHTPMRYLWEFRDVYFKRYPALIRGMIEFFLNQLKRFDLKTNERVDLFIANSQYIRERIKRVYDRDAVVVHPPCELDFFSPGENNILSPVILSPEEDEESSKEILPTDLAFARNHGGQDDKAIAPLADGSREPFYLAVSHFVPYKRLDIVIKAFNELDRPLVIIGCIGIDHRAAGFMNPADQCKIVIVTLCEGWISADSSNIIFIKQPFPDRNSREVSGRTAKQIKRIADRHRM